MKQIPWIKHASRIGWIILDEYDIILRYIYDPFKKGIPYDTCM